MISRLIQCLALTAVVAVMLASCSSDKSTSSNTTVVAVNLKFVGTVNGDDGVMTASIVFTVADSVVTGTLKVTAPAAATVTLNGHYNTTTKALTGAGGGYNFAGTYDGSSHCDGTMTGTKTGIFVTIKDDSNTAVLRHVCWR
jgi:hypothetical protein